MIRWAKLENKKVVECPMLEAAPAMENTEARIVGKTIVGDAEVSTVFLAMDHGYEGPPLWFETMVFGGKFEDYQRRYTTWEEAEQGHKEVVKMVGDE